MVLARAPDQRQAAIDGGQRLGIAERFIEPGAAADVAFVFTGRKRDRSPGEV
jgi:hypothetical protein